MEIRAKIAEQIKNIAPTVENQIIETLVNREVAKRSDALVKALDMLRQFENDLKKINPDQISYNLDGSTASAFWSKGKLEEKNKKQAQIDKLTKAIEKALTAGEYAGVYDLCNQKQG